MACAVVAAPTPPTPPPSVVRPANRPCGHRRMCVKRLVSQFAAVACDIRTNGPSPTDVNDPPTPIASRLPPSGRFGPRLRCAYATIRYGFCSPDLADFHDLYISSDEKLFNEILTCPNHIVRTLLPPPTAQNYSLRKRPQNRQLPDRISRITDCNSTVLTFIYFRPAICFIFVYSTTAV